MTYDIYTDIGERSCNEDSVYHGKNDNGELLFVIADGLGGHGGGDMASQLTVKQLAENFLTGELDIAASIARINDSILQLQQEQSVRCRSTVALILMTAQGITAATVGDTRIYAFKGTDIIFQSTDHSGAQLAVDVGEITPDCIRGHEDRNILTRALGASETVKVDIRTPYNTPDALLICSDGFWECITESEMICELESSKNASEWLLRMVNRVKAARIDEKDNNSAIAIMLNNS